MIPEAVVYNQDKNLSTDVPRRDMVIVITNYNTCVTYTDLRK
jgi:hypothetical protein